MHTRQSGNLEIQVSIQGRGRCDKSKLAYIFIFSHGRSVTDSYELSPEKFLDVSNHAGSHNYMAHARGYN